MGSGKTQTGRLLALKMRLLHEDLDEIIEKKEGISIAEIFSQKGEIKFRKIEHELLKDLMESPESFVLSLGGGTPCYAGNHKFLKSPGVVSIYLKTSIDVLSKRLATENRQRPLVANLSPEDLNEFIGKHLFERNYFYNQASYTVNTDGKSPEAIVAEIEKLLV